MIRFASALCVLALAATAPAAAQEAARDFQLPPAPAPTQENRVQGPVDEDAPVPVRPRAIETARPAVSTPSPAATATPVIVLPTPTARADAPARAPAATSPRATGVAVVPTPLAPITQADQATPASTTPPVAAPRTPASPIPTPTAAEQGSSLSWWSIVPGLVVLAGAAVVLLRRRRAVPEAPTILAPLTSAATMPLGSPGEALAISVEAVRMDRSVMNATVGYRVTLRNRTTQALSGVAVEADLVSASKDRPAEAQLASPGQALTPRHTAERLAPGQSLRFEGQVRLPLAEASAIWQGRVGLLVPLLRVRATASGAEPIATTLVIGRREGGAARPQPFRLDEPPRSYAPLAQRVLDAVPVRA
jgi:hypothetical protein